MKDNGSLQLKIRIMKQLKSRQQKIEQSLSSSNYSNGYQEQQQKEHKNTQSYREIAKLDTQGESNSNKYSSGLYKNQEPFNSNLRYSEFLDGDISEKFETEEIQDRSDFKYFNNQRDNNNKSTQRLSKFRPSSQANNTPNSPLSMQGQNEISFKPRLPPMMKGSQKNNIVKLPAIQTPYKPKCHTPQNQKAHVQFKKSTFAKAQVASSNNNIEENKELSLSCYSNLLRDGLSSVRQMGLRDDSCSPVKLQQADSSFASSDSDQEGEYKEEQALNNNFKFNNIGESSPKKTFDLKAWNLPYTNYNPAILLNNEATNEIKPEDQQQIIDHDKQNKYISENQVKSLKKLQRRIKISINHESSQQNQEQSQQKIEKISPLLKKLIYNSKQRDLKQDHGNIPQRKI